MGIEADFLAWTYMYMQRHLKCPFSRMHIEWMTFLNERRAAIAAPRNFAKTSIFSFFYPLYKMLERPKTGIFLLSATGALTEKILSKIRNEIETNEDILRDYGDMIGDKWTNDHLVFRNGSELQAKGYGYQARGFRPDIVIIDDAETSVGVMSEEQRIKWDGWFRNDIMGLLSHCDRDSQLILVGTVLHPLSFLHLVMQGMFKSWSYKTYRAIENEESVWPERWPTRVLQELREEIGEPAFQQEYMNNPVPDSWRTFHSEDFKFWDSLPPDLSFTTTVDPAISQDHGADYTAVTTVGLDSQSFWWVAEVTRGHFTPQQIVDVIFAHFDKWKPHTIGIEEVGFQQMLRFALDESSKNRKVYPVFIPLKLDFAKGKKKRFRIEALQPLFRNGKIYLHRSQQSLIDELICFPTGKHDDCIDSLASHLEIARPGKKAGSEHVQPGTWDWYWQKVDVETRGQRRWHDA